MEIKIRYTPRFVKHFRKVPSNIQKLVVNKEKIFKKDCFNSVLKTHKLSGNLSGFYSFSINYSYRIVFSLETSGIVFIDIGTHSIYK